MAVDMKTIRQRPDGTWEAEDYNREDWHSVEPPGETIERLQREVGRLREALKDIRRTLANDPAHLACLQADRALQTVQS